MKDVLIESLTKAIGIEFASALLGTCNMQNTAKDHLDGVKSLLNFAVDKLGGRSTSGRGGQCRVAIVATLSPVLGHPHGVAADGCRDVIKPVVLHPLGKRTISLVQAPTPRGSLFIGSRGGSLNLQRCA